MPYWKPEEEKQLAETLSKAESLEELAKALNRSPEAVAMKLKRMGLQAPPRKTEKSSAKNSEKKNSFFATTTTPTSAPKLEPVPFKELPSANEMMGLLVAAIRRLQEPDVSKDEAKKLRLLIQTAKTYIHLEAGVVLRMRHVESNMLAEWQHMAAVYERELARAHSEEDKALFTRLLQEAKQHIKEFVELGVKEPKKLREEQLS